MPEPPTRDDEGDRPHSHRAYDLRLAATYLALLVIGIVIAAASSRFGRDSIAINSGDFALHMIAVETSYHNFRLVDAPGERRMAYGDMATYPRWSHVLVGYTAALLNADPLKAMQVWIAAILVAGCLIMALRIAYASNDPPTVAAIFSAALFLAACAYAGFGLRGHIERNFFFPQFVGTVVAIGVFEVLRRVILNPYIAALVILIIGAFVLPNIHLIPAVWFTLASLIALFLRGSDMRVSLLLCLVVGIAALFEWTGFGAGSGEAMIKMADSNGWFLTRFGILSNAGTEVAVGLGLFFAFISVVALGALRSNPWSAVRIRLVPHAGLIAVCILILAQSVMYLMMNKGSVYAITKYLYLLATETAVLLAVLRRPILASANRCLQHHPAGARLACVILFFFAQAPFMATPYDQSTLMEVRGKLAALRNSLDPNNRVYPQFSAFDYAQNYYLALAVMRIPSDARTGAWIQHGAVGERAFTWPSGAGIDPNLGDDPTKRVAPPTQYAYTIRLRTDSPLVELQPGVFTMHRPAVLHVEILMPHQASFHLATDLTGRKGEVTFGARAFDEATGRTFELRSLLERVKTPEGVVLRTDMKLSDLPPSVSHIDLGPVQEYVTWFYQQSSPNLRRLVFAPGKETDRP